MVAWDPRSVRADDPFAYRATTLPAFDRNLRNLAGKLAPTCLIAHVRGVTHSEHEMVAETNLHPFRFRGARVALAHNGHLREFAACATTSSRTSGRSWRERSRGRPTPSGSTRSCSRSSRIPTAEPETRELADAAAAALRVLREVRARHGIDTSSPGEPVPRDGRGARRHAVLVRLRLVSRRGRAARDGPAVLQPLVHGRRRVRRGATADPRWRRATPYARC